MGDRVIGDRVMGDPGLAGYKTSGHRLVPPLWRWAPLAWQEFCYLFRRRWGIALFCFCLLPFVARLFVLMVRYGVVNFGGMRASMIARSQAFAQWDPTRAEFYVESVVQTFPGLPVLVLLTSVAMAGAVARDRAANALELLWTRGIGPGTYLFAKWFGAGALLALTTVVGPLALWVFAVSVAEDWSLLADTVAFVPPLLGGLCLVTMVWAAYCVLLSCLSSTTSQAIVAWCVVMIGSSAVANIMAVVFREPEMRSWISIWDAGGVIARWAAGVGTRGAPVVPAALVLGGGLAILLLVVRRRLRLTEAVA